MPKIVLLTHMCSSCVHREQKEKGPFVLCRKRHTIMKIQNNTRYCFGLSENVGIAESRMSTSTDICNAKWHTKPRNKP